jgi:hypothetical protein
MNNRVNAVTQLPSFLRSMAIVMGFALVLVGCGGAASPATTGDGGALDVTGTWSGNATDSAGKAHPMTMVVTQTGTTVAGTGTFDAKATTITGTVSGTMWTGTLADGAAQFATYSYTVSGNAANGTGTSSKDGTSAAIKLTR